MRAQKPLTMRKKPRLTRRHLRTIGRTMRQVTRLPDTIHKDMDMLIIICNTTGRQPATHRTMYLVIPTTTLQLEMKSGRMSLILTICDTKGRRPVIYRVMDLLIRTTTLQSGMTSGRMSMMLTVHHTISDRNILVAHIALLTPLPMVRILRT